MAASDSESDFRVTDRRRRAEATEPAPPAPSHASSTRAEEPPRDPSPPLGGGSRPAGPAERTLEGLFLTLASSAVVALGEVADPTGQARRDPGAASNVIDLLVLLREKTEGHRTPRESKLLEELIYDLQLRYVAAMKPRL
jgi:hypothetical protein